MALRNAFQHTLIVEAPIAFAVLAFILCVLSVAIVRGRARPGRQPSKRANHPRLETTVLTLLLCTAVFLVWFDLSKNNAEARPLGRPELVVDVTASQWCWKFHYERQPVTVDADCVRGSYPTLALPTNRVVELRVTSTDVIHGFWIPYLRYKIYAMPDHVNTFEVDLTQTGTWPGRCAVFCGLYHSTMDFTLRVMDAHRFSRWLNANSGSQGTPS